MKKLSKIMLMAFVIGLMPLCVAAESCSAVGSKQNKYTASGCSYTTSTRTCCSNKTWSDWGKDCASCSSGYTMGSDGTCCLNSNKPSDNGDYYYGDGNTLTENGADYIAELQFGSATCKGGKWHISATNIYECLYGERDGSNWRCGFPGRVCNCWRVDEDYSKYSGYIACPSHARSLASTLYGYRNTHTSIIGYGDGNNQYECYYNNGTYHAVCECGTDSEIFIDIPKDFAYPSTYLN